MRSLTLLMIFGLGLFSPLLTPDSRAQTTNNTLSWNPSSSPGLAGYYLAWGTNSGVYFATNTYGPTETSGIISNLAYNVVYYAAAAAFSSNGMVSPFSNEAMFSNAPPAGVVGSSPIGATPVVTNANLAGGGPPAPPTPGKPGSKPAPPGGGSGTSASSGSSAAASVGSSTSTNITQAQIWGIPPVLNLAVTNSQPTLTIGGTVGATVAVQTSSDLTAAYSWTTVTNVTLTNAAPIANPSTGQPQDAIDLAYVPAAQPTMLPPSASPNGMQFFRVMMPYDYIVLAGLVLPPKGYNARLIMVNMPGLNDDCCYVAQTSSFIHYSRTNAALQLAGSGSTIRQIATTMANNLKMDWTSASEFVYSNGVGQILATVVETDPASSDPVAGTAPTSSININF